MRGLPLSKTCMYSVPVADCRCGEMSGAVSSTAMGGRCSVLMAMVVWVVVGMAMVVLVAVVMIVMPMPMTMVVVMIVPVIGAGMRALLGGISRHPFEERGEVALKLAEAAVAHA